MKTNANEGSGKVYWIMAVTILVLLAGGVLLWWYDLEWAHKRTVVHTFDSQTALSTISQIHAV